MIGDSSRLRGPLNDLAVELASKSAGFRRSISPDILPALAGLVRSMNCYYSNLIEGHNTHPVDIELALKNDYSADPAKRDLQLEAKAHIAVQFWIDTGGLRTPATSVQTLVDLHRKFSEALPETLLWTVNPETQERHRVEPGRFRLRDVRVGNHVAISPGAIARFLDRFENAYHPLGKLDSILAAAAAHHRFVWIHPFLDGNGRVSRLMSHAMLLAALDTGSIWSVSRGLARNVGTYKQKLAEADLPRRNDLDGRGSLSEEGLANFTRFFLETCLDQVSFMESLVEPNRLRLRIKHWADEEIGLGNLPSQSAAVLETLLNRGAVSRGDVGIMLNVGDRQARRIVQSLISYGVVASHGPREPLTLAFPAKLAGRWMPGLFPDKPA